MKAAIAKVVRSSFDAAIRERAPELSLVADAQVPPGSRQYGGAVGKVSFFLTLLIHSKTDSFDVELGWSTKGRDPALAYSAPGRPDMTDREEVRFSMRRLRSPEPFDLGWQVASKADIQATVDDAVGMIHQHVVPYLVDVAKKKNLL